MKRPFEQVVAEHGGTVLRVCRAVLGPSPDADDAWSETFLAAMRAWPALPEDANAEAWLVTIAHRKAIDIIRAGQRHPSTGEAPPEGVSTIGVPGRGDGDIWRAVKALPPRQRQAIAYHYLGGLPFREVAAIIGGSTDAARRAAADGIRALRSALAPAQREGTSR
jgi:RNA polymerase sigma factor (sigma-70 family)